MNITFIDINYDNIDEYIDIYCIVNGNFTYENNITIKNELKYKTFFNNYTINWEKNIFLYKINYFGKNSASIYGYSLYSFNFYIDGKKVNEIKFIIYINDEKSDNYLICTKGEYNNYNQIILKFKFYCEIYYSNSIINYDDIITFQEFKKDNFTIKDIKGNILKIEGVIRLYNDYDEECTENGYNFILWYNIINYYYIEKNILSHYSIKNLINPINNKPINGTCYFIKNEQKMKCEINSFLIDISYILINNNFLEKDNNSLPDIYIDSEYRKPRIYFKKPIFCAKNITFTIHKIKEGKCLDGTYSFLLIGILSNTKGNMNKIYIRDIIENEIQIYCNNLSIYDINYYSFNCYVINDISEQLLNISLLEKEPPKSDIISIEYSPEFKNKNIILNYKCNNGNIFNSRFRDFYNKFNSTLKLIYPYFNNLLKDYDINIFSFKIITKIDKYPNNNKLYEYTNKYAGGYLVLPTNDPEGVSFCYIKDKNITRDMILECFGICDYYDDLNENKIDFEEYNSLHIFDNDISPKFTFMGFIYKDLYDFDLEYPFS